MGMPSDIKTQLIVFRSFAVVSCLVSTGAIAINSDNSPRTFVLRKEPNGSGLRRQNLTPFYGW